MDYTQREREGRKTMAAASTIDAKSHTSDRSEPVTMRSLPGHSCGCAKAKLTIDTTAASTTVTIVDRYRALTCHRPAIVSEEHTSELQSRFDLVCRLLLEKQSTT